MPDKTTIGISPENDLVLQKIMEKGFFLQEMDAAKFAMSLAILKGETKKISESYNTKWNVGTFDTDDKLKKLFFVLYPKCDEPYKKSEMLANNGLKIIGQHMDDNGDLLLDVLIGYDWETD